MVFSELYGAYYNTVARILQNAVKGGVTAAQRREIIESVAFSESVLAIEPALRECRWQLMNSDGSTPLRHIPTMPLTELQRRWLRSITLDPRIKLFECDFSYLEGTEPLFTPDDYYIFDSYSDGDDCSSEEYRTNFRIILNAVSERRPLKIDMVNKRNEVVTTVLMPDHIEYSEKDDAYWNAASRHEFRLVDISKPQVDDDIPLSLFSMLPVYLYTRIEVLAHEKARLYFDSKLRGVLEPGVYYFWKCGVKVQVSCVDTRLTQLNVCGQEIMSQDKVALRINFVCNYKITDFVKISTEIDDYKEQIHNAAQLALRDFVGRYKLDDILLNKNEMTQFVLSKLKEKESELYVKFYDAGVKDIILPGEIRSIMNTVLVAEKKAQASVITRREEVASTRSLLNTAKLMDENATLYKLKELEYLERICENVGSINLNGSGDVINQLAALITNK